MAGKQARTAAPSSSFTVHDSQFTIHNSIAVGTPAWILFGLIVAGAVLRTLRLDWQPLWWDEGYSVYFGTEPLARMLWLTARDIHPPLYYALLHGWTALRMGADPVTVRALSVFLGIAALPLIYWLGRVLLPHRPRVARLALLLLIVNPMHLFYSQEVRMYGLAMALGLAGTACFWHFVRSVDRGTPRSALLSWPSLGYLLTAVAALYTLYYTALLLLAHFAWAAWHWRRKLGAVGALAVVDALVLVAYLPWLLYAVPQLIGYVGGKVQSDQDIPLGPLAYAERHLAAFTAGHVRPPWLTPDALLLALPTIGICALILGLVLRATLRLRLAEASHPAAGPEESPAPAGALWTWVLVPLLAGWLINLRFPFFPAGGERMLLIVLPYFLVLLALAADQTWSVWQLGKIGYGALVGGSLLGVAAFYTTPRYAADDYRPVLRQVVQQGANGDAMLAIFPWQVGYWRAYVPQHDPLLEGPQPRLLADGAVEWSPQVQATVDAALNAGTLWFPEPLTFGSTLPPAIEGYLAGRAVNLANRWYDATRLTAWRPLPAPATRPIGADFGPVRLLEGGISPSVAASANTPVAVSLVWERTSDDDFNVSLRVQSTDGNGDVQVWSSREYLAEPPPRAGVYSETVGLIVPVGLPPGAYEVAVSVQSAAGAALTIAGSDAIAAPVGTLEVMQPDTTQSPLRLPVQMALERPAADGGLSIAGFSGVVGAPQIMAGTPLAVTLFLTNASDAPPDRQIYVAMQDADGAGVAGFEGWPLPEYPTATWLPGAAVQVPVSFFLPGTLTTGDYRLVAGFLDPVTGAKGTPVELTRVPVEQRAGVFAPPAMQVALPSPAQFGTHARLLGYDLATDANASTHLRLHWEITQPLLPPHHIFVHADAADGTTVAQQDGPPATAAEAAPSGSWQPGEYLTTVHTLRPPDGAPVTLRVGLYDPRNGVRLPVTVTGAPAGDNVAIALP